MTVSKVTLMGVAPASVGNDTFNGVSFRLPVRDGEVIQERTLPDGTTEVSVNLTDKRVRRLLAHALLASLHEDTPEEPPAPLTVAIDSQELVRVLLPQLVNELRGKSDVRSL